MKSIAVEIFTCLEIAQGIQCRKALLKALTIS